MKASEFDKKFDEGTEDVIDDLDLAQAKRINELRSGLRRRPTHPGEILREDFLPDYGLTISGLADSLGVSRQTVNELLRERRSLSPQMALRLSALFGNSPEFWLNLQRAVDLWDAQVSVAKDLRRIKPLRVA
jgi:addiction module HigA family antidote